MKPTTIRLEGSADLDAAAVDDLARAIETAGADSNGRRRHRRVLVELGSPPAQRRHLVDLPPTRRHHLRQMVAHQAHRFFRRTPNGLVVDATWNSRRSGDATAVAVDRGVIDAILGAAARSKTEVVDIVPRSEWVLLGLSLLPPEEKRRRSRREWRKTALTAGVTFALLGILGLASTWQRTRAHSAVDAELARLRLPALRVQSAHRSVDSAEAMILAVRRARAESGAIAHLLDALAQSLPDSALVSSLTIDRAGAGELSGLALEPLRTVAVLRKSRSFEYAALSAAPIPEPAGGKTWSRFAIRLDSALPK